MQIQKRLDEIEAAKARVGTLIKDFFADLHIEMHRLGTFRPVPEAASHTADVIEAAVNLATGKGRKKRKRVSAYRKNKFLRLAKKRGAHPYTIMRDMGLGRATVHRWMKEIKSGKL